MIGKQSEPCPAVVDYSFSATGAADTPFSGAAQAGGRPGFGADVRSVGLRSTRTLRPRRCSGRALAESPEPTSAWSHKASLHLSRGELVDAIHCAQQIERTARRLGEHSAFVPVLAVHAVVRSKLNRAKDCARVRGAAPRRWSLFLLRERDQMDGWLATQLTRADLAALAAEGRTMALEDLLSIAPSAVASER